MVTRWPTAAIALALWLLLTRPVDPHTGGVDPPGPVARPGRWLDPRRWLWSVAFVAVFLWEVLLANLDVAYRILHPRMPIRPGIVKVRTALESATARSVLANAITLTPGTLTVELVDGGELYVHWLNVRSTDAEQASERIVGRFERILRRIVE